MRPLHKPFYLGGVPNNPRYKVTHLLGKGGMGTVFKAEDLSLRNEVLKQKNEVAIKAMDISELPDDADEQEIEKAKSDQARFRLEARALANLDHPYIVKVTDFFEGTLPKGGEAARHYFYVMNYQENTETLEDMIKKSGPLNKKNIITLIDQVGSAIEYCHSRDVIHRDLKPSQILLTRDRQGNIVESRLADFGLVKLLKKAEGLQSVSGLTAEGDLLGTPIYMPPEAIDGKFPITEAADVYMWAATIFTALTGEPPMDFRGVGQTALAYVTTILQYRDGDRPLRQVTEFRDDLPENMQMYIEKAMAPKPAERMPSVSIFNKAIKNAFSPKKKTKTQKYLREQKSNKLVQIVGGILVGAFIAVGGYMLGNGNKTIDPIVNGTENPIPENGTSENHDNGATKDPITPTVDEKAKLSYIIHGNFDQASLHPYIKQNDRFIPQHEGTQLTTSKGTLESEVGRYEIKIMYDDTKQFVVPIKLTSGETLEQHLWVPEFYPNDFRELNGDKLTTSTWRYITVDEDGKNRSHWRLDQWTILDHANFVEKGVLEPNVHYLTGRILENMRKKGEQITSSTFDGIKASIYESLADPSKRFRGSMGNIWHEVMFRSPSHPTDTESYGRGIHSQPFLRIQDKRMVPDPNQTQLTASLMREMPLTSIMRGSAEDPRNTTNAFAYSLVRELEKHLGSGYIVKIPSKEQHFIAMTGGPEGSPIFAFGDRDEANPQRKEYVKRVREDGFDALRPLSSKSVSPYGIPIHNGAPRQYTDLNVSAGNVQKFYTAQFDQDGFSIQEHTNPDQRSAMNGVTYIIEKSD